MSGTLPTDIAFRFIVTIEDMMAVCRALGVKPPTEINFGTAFMRNSVTDALERYREAHPGTPYADAVRTVEHGNVTLFDIKFRVAN